MKIFKSTLNETLASSRFVCITIFIGENKNTNIHVHHLLCWLFCSIGCHGDYCRSSFDYLCYGHLHRLLLSPQVSQFITVLDSIVFFKYVSFLACQHACIYNVYFICSYKRDALDKLKISNNSATCVRNNGKPVDNMFTGRLPVSAGPQHHQCQQNHQQLLIPADDISTSTEQRTLQI